MSDPRFTDQRMIAKGEMARQLDLNTTALSQDSNLRGQDRTDTRFTITIGVQAKTNAKTLGASNSNTEQLTGIISSKMAPGNLLTTRELETFELFPKLPREVQLLIWKSAATQGQAITIVENSILFENFVRPTSPFHRVRGIVTEGGFPSVLRVCKDSRTEALKVHYLCVDKIFLQPFFFVPGIDTVTVETDNGHSKTMKWTGGWDAFCNEFIRFLFFSAHSAFEEREREIARLEEVVAETLSLLLPSHV